MFKNSLLFILLAASFLIGKDALSQNSITYSTTGSNCSDSTSGLISIYVNGGQAPYQYVLSNGAFSTNNNSGLFYNLGAGTYTVSVTDALGVIVSSSGIVIPVGVYLEVNPSNSSICPNSNLQISVSGGNGNYNWSAIPVDPTLLFAFNDSVLVSPVQNTVYTVATNALNTNLIFNGTFEYGDLGFFSAYSSLFPTNPSGLQESYGITNNASSWYPNYSACVDHTLGNGIGKMMVLDGATNGTSPFWEQTIAVEKNKNYVFTYFAQSLTNTNPAEIQAVFNGVTMGIDTLQLITCDWVSTSYNWFSGNDSSITIVLTDLNNSAIGNDFALDDLSFSTLLSCSNTSTVQITTNNIDLGLQYPANACVGGSNLTPTLNPNYPANGSFNVIPAGLNVHPVTGIINLTNANPGNYQIIYSLPICNQLSHDTAIITIRARPSLLELTGGDYYCVGQTFNPLSLLVTGTPNWDIFFSLDGVPQSVLNVSSLPILIGNSVGTYVLDSIHDAYCSNVLVGSQTIAITDGPQVPQFLGDTTFCEDEATTSIQITNINGAGSFNWYNDSSLNNYLFSDDELYPSNDTSAIFYVTQTVNGCEGPYGMLSITVFPCGFVIPTAFTPNGDNQNDTWGIVGIDAKYPTNIVKVFNRWGELLYESSEGNYSSNEWDGTYNGEPLPVGSYYYIIELAKDQSSEPLNGTVSIIRLK
jgi:gliding motility-associated-like protein